MLIEPTMEIPILLAIFAFWNFVTAFYFVHNTNPEV